MLTKRKRLVDPTAIKAARKQYCEVCGRQAYGEPHHIITRGAGGPDHKYNLIQLCAICHYGKIPSGKLSRWFLFGIVARREGLTVEEVEDMVCKMRTSSRA